MTDLIAFTGRAQSGKGSAAQCLTDRGWVKVSFADPLRQAMRGLAMEVFYRGCWVKLNELWDSHGYEEVKKIPAFRKTMQRLGDEAGRQIHGEDCWVRIAEQTVTDLLYSGQKVVLDDCRYDNEAEMVQRLGGAVVLIQRGTDTHFEHQSEAGINPLLVHRKIQNDGSLADLDAKVVRLLSSSHG